MRMGGRAARVCTDCPAYACDLERSHPLSDWQYDLLDLSLVWSGALDVLRQCCDGDMGEQAEADYNNISLPLVKLRERPASVVGHELAMSRCAAHAYGARAPRPARARDTLSGRLDRLPSKRLSVDRLRMGLREDEKCVLDLALSSPLLKDFSRVHASPCRLDRGEVEDLLQAGVIELSTSRPHITLPVFSIAKKDGSRRLLVDGRRFDELATPLPPPLLPKLADFENFVRRFRYFSVLDFLGYFLQIPVHEEVRRCLGFRMAGGDGPPTYYRFTVAVPGIARAPLVAQLCTLAARRLAGVSRDSVATYDDVGIGGATREEALARERSLREAARHADMSIREDKGFSGEDVGELCGMILDLAAKEISLPGSWVTKVATVYCTPRTLSCRAASHHIGCMWWAHYVMREPLACRPLLMRLGRALGSACRTAADWDAVMRLPEGYWREMRGAEEWMRTCPPRVLVEPTVEWHLWTDASDQGGSVVLLDPVRELVLVRQSWRWPEALPALRSAVAPIRRRELYAAMLGCLVSAAVVPRGCRLRVFHDNTTAESRHRKLSSPHPQECELLARTDRALRRAGVCDVRTTLVPSGRMVADADTRGG